jgi:exoribonuclease R
MVRRRIRLGRGDAAAAAGLAGTFDRIRAELGVPERFPPEVLAAAQEAARAPHPDRADLTAMPFVTVDPPGSTDLDQALHLSRAPGGGYRVEYAIADVPAFLVPGGPVDVEAMRRGLTLYAPDRRIPLHPEVLSEGAASLLPNQPRPAFVWRFTLDGAGRVTTVDVVRALVRSRARLDYGQVQAAADAVPSDRPLPDLQADPLTEQAVLLREIGVRRLALEVARGGASLPMPEQVVSVSDGGYRLGLRPALPAEDWNAQLSLMTGMAAADLMLGGRVGLLRTMPAPDPALVDRYRRQVDALGVRWPAEQPYGDFLRGLDRSDGRQLAAIHEAVALFRGAGYTPLDGELPPLRTHAAVAAPYAHVTAPLRRLVDRFGLVVCSAIGSGALVPDWARAALPGLPAAMRSADRIACALERACVDAVEAVVLAARVGQTFPAVVVDVGRDGGTSGGTVQLPEPAVTAGCSGPLALGDALQVRLVEADPGTGRVRFAPA